MTDVNGAPAPHPGADAAEAERNDLIACAELLFFAYRDFTGEPDDVLAHYKFGRAHHRVLHFVNRNPGLRVADLLDILRITKQSLARVLNDLIDQGFVARRSGAEDRRERRLFVTAKGGRLAEKLTALQLKRLKLARLRAGPGADAAARSFLFAMIGEQDRSRVKALIRMEPQEASPPGGPDRKSRADAP